MAKGKFTPDEVSSESPAAPSSAEPGARWRVNAKEMADLLQVTRPTIAKWVDKGAPCVSPGRPGVAAVFDAPAFIAWWVENILKAKDDKPAKLYEREQLVDIETKELKLRQLKSDLIERAAARHVIRGLHTQTVSVYRQMPRRFAAQLVGLPDVAAAVEVLTRIVESQIRDLRLPETWQAISETADGPS